MGGQSERAKRANSGCNKNDIVNILSCVVYTKHNTTTHTQSTLAGSFILFIFSHSFIFARDDEGLSLNLQEKLAKQYDEF